MKTYPHEHTTDKTTLPNTSWPIMSTDSVDIDNMRNYLQGRDLSSRLADENGWYPSRNAMDNFLRIVIPAVSTFNGFASGHVYWQARAVSSNVHIRYQTPKGPRNGALIHVRAFPDDEHSRKVVIVEGPMDALAVAACGYDAIALMGMSPGDAALVHLVKLVAKRPALVVLDNEPEAQKAAHVIVMLLASTGRPAHNATIHYVKDIALMKFPMRKSWLERCMEEL